MDDLGGASLSEVKEEFPFLKSDHLSFYFWSGCRSYGDDHRTFGDGWF